MHAEKIEIFRVFHGTNRHRARRVSVRAVSFLFVCMCVITGQLVLLNRRGDSVQSRSRLSEMYEFGRVAHRFSSSESTEFSVPTISCCLSLYFIIFEEFNCCLCVYSNFASVCGD
jgi:hypothetical protein